MNSNWTVHRYWRGNVSCAIRMHHQLSPSRQHAPLYRVESRSLSHPGWRAQPTKPPSWHRSPAMIPQELKLPSELPLMVKSGIFLFFSIKPGAKAVSSRSAPAPLSKRGNFGRLSGRFNYSGSCGTGTIGTRIYGPSTRISPLLPYPGGVIKNRKTKPLFLFRIVQDQQK